MKLSRAKWQGEWYFRKGSNTWRNSNNGKVATNPTGKALSIERTRLNTYGKDTSAITKKLNLISQQGIKPTKKY